MTALSPVHRQILGHARACLGTRFRHQGRMIGVGLDCVGLIVHVMRAMDWPVADYIHYGRLPGEGLLEARLQRAGLLPIEQADALPGDVALLGFGAGPQHVGLYSDAGLIHAYLLARHVVEHRWDPVWAARLCGAYRFAGVA